MRILLLAATNWEHLSVTRKGIRLLLLLLTSVIFTAAQDMKAAPAGPASLGQADLDKWTNQNPVITPGAPPSLAKVQNSFFAAINNELPMYNYATFDPATPLAPGADPTLIIPGQQLPDRKYRDKGFAEVQPSVPFGVIKGKLFNAYVGTPENWKQHPQIVQGGYYPKLVWLQITLDQQQPNGDWTFSVKNMGTINNNPELPLPMISLLSTTLAGFFVHLRSAARRRTHWTTDNSTQRAVSSLSDAPS